MGRVPTAGLLLSFIVLTGCSIQFNFYIRNFTNDKTYVLKLVANSTGQLSNVSNYVLMKNEILEMNGRAWNKMTDTLRTKITNDTLMITISPRTTVLLPFLRPPYNEIQNLEVNGLLTVDSAIVDSFVVYPSSATEKIKRTSGFLQFIDYYDIKPNN